LERPPLADVPWNEKKIAGAKGDPEVTIYVVNAKPGASRGGILHTHGGGYVLGAAKSEIGSLQALAVELDCAIVSVEYRLAPETRYSGSIEDNYAGLRFLHDHADELGVDRSRLAVMGESAGGGHAALLAITARDRGEVPLAFQCLVYPMLDDRTGSSRQAPETVGTLLWTAASNRFGWRSFLGVEPGGANVPAQGVPARVEKLEGLPPAFVGVGSIDLFVEEDIDYARRLIAANVPAELLVVPGAFHGFDLIAADTSVAKRFTAAKHEALRRGLSS
jgi:acetyl esterase/lipase